MFRFEYNGNIYERVGGGWRGADKAFLHGDLKRAVDAAYNEKCAHELASSSASKQKYILPQMMSSMRQHNNARGTIDFAKAYCGNDISAINDTAVLTSLAAAYCDVKEYGNAKLCCDQYLKINREQIDFHMQRVMARLEWISKH